MLVPGLGMPAHKMPIAHPSDFGDSYGYTGPEPGAAVFDSEQLPEPLQRLAADDQILAPHARQEDIPAGQRGPMLVPGPGQATSSPSGGHEEGQAPTAGMPLQKAQSEHSGSPLGSDSLDPELPPQRPTWQPGIAAGGGMSAGFLAQTMQSAHPHDPFGENWMHPELVWQQGVVAGMLAQTIWSAHPGGLFGDSWMHLWQRGVAAEGGSTTSRARPPQHRGQVASECMSRPSTLHILLAQRLETQRAPKSMPTRPSRAGKNHVFKDRKLVPIYREVVRELLPKLPEVQRPPDQDLCQQQWFHPDGRSDPGGSLCVWILSEHFDPGRNSLACEFDQFVVTPTFRNATQYLLAVDAGVVADFKSRAEGMILEQCKTKVELTDAGFAYIKDELD
ncbi:unnamed protein product [Effrenium voratum]|nr:unnamed protein product [Effrenium voratum]